jgi:hypothetical protein
VSNHDLLHFLKRDLYFITPSESPFIGYIFQRSANLGESLDKLFVVDANTKEPFELCECPRCRLINDSLYFFLMNLYSLCPNNMS